MVAAEGYVGRAVGCGGFYWKVGCCTPPTARQSSVVRFVGPPVEARHRLVGCPLQWRIHSTLLMHTSVKRLQQRGRLPVVRCQTAPWCLITCRAYSVYALSLTMRRMWSDADRLLLNVTPRIFSELSWVMSGAVAAEFSTFLAHVCVSIM